MTTPTGRRDRPDWSKLEFRLSQPGLRRLPATDPRVALSAPLHDPVGEQRRSHREFRAVTVPFAGLSALLGALRQRRIAESPLPKYGYASAGHLYPVQVHLYARAGGIESLEAGAYYYDPVDNTLVLLTPNARLDAASLGAHNARLWENAGFVIFLIGHAPAMTPLYPEAAMRFMQLEAGLIAQLRETTSVQCGLGLCQIGRVQQASLADDFRLGDDDHLVHALVGGVPV